jgi:hypothetical protein
MSVSITPEHVAQHLLEIAFDPACRPAEVCIQVPMPREP